MPQPLLELRNLNVAFDTDSGQIRPVQDVSLSVFPGQTLAVVGESGCGKSTLARTILQSPKPKSGNIVFNDVDLYINIPYSGPTLAYTNLTGHPTLIARCGMVDEFPVMLEYVGALYREDAVCRVALAYEQVTDWTGKWPDTEKIPPV